MGSPFNNLMDLGVQGLQSQDLGQQLPQPQVGGPPAGSPPPANNSQNAGPVKSGLRAVMQSMLGSMAYGAGQSMVKAAGLPTDREIAMQNAQLAHLNAQTQMTQEQAKQMATMVTLPNGIQVPFAIAQKAFPEALKAQSAQNVANINKRWVVTPQGMYDTQTPDANGMPTLVLGSAAGIMVTPNVAKEYNLGPEWIGKMAKMTDLSSAQRGQASQYGFVMGANGPAREMKAGPTGSLGLGSPAVAAAGAKYVPVQDTTTGAVTYMPAAQAAATGAISPQTGMEKNAFVPAARFADINRVVTATKNNVDAYDQGPGQKGLIASALNSPESQGMGAVMAVAKSKAFQDMNPKSRDLVTSVLSLREQIMGANAMLTGANGTTDARIQAIWDTLPNGTEPDSDMARRKIGLAEGMIKNLQSAFPQTQLIGSGAGKPNSTVPKAVSNRKNATAGGGGSTSVDSLLKKHGF